MASSWIERRRTGDGLRYRVKYRLGGRGSPQLYGGSFRTPAEAEARRSRVALNIAAMRDPLAGVSSSGIEIDSIPGFLSDLDEPIAVALRHEPDDASRRLLEGFGARWTIDPDAPRCVRACGRPECRRTAAELRRIAELVDEETRRRDLPRVRERVERGIENGMRVVREPLVRYGERPMTATNPLRESFGAERNGATPAEPVHAYACRTDGCENRANAKWPRGALSGLCWETCVPKMKLRLSEGAKRRGLGSAVRTVETPEPAAPEPVPEAEARGATLAELAADLERAHRIFDDAEAEYEDAVERFLDHPIVRQLDVGYRPAD